MPHMENSKEFADVSSVGTVNDCCDKYDSYYGKYTEQKPMVGSTPAPVGQTPPFTLGGK
jgi:hypothetical protein